MTVISDEDVGAAVVVHVAGANALGPAFEIESASRAQGCKFSLTFIPVEARQARNCRVFRQSGAVQKEHIVESVAIHIEDGGAVSRRLQDEILALFASENIDSTNPELVRHLHQMDGLPVRQHRQTKEK